jgi:hypothetical protein
MNTLFHHTDPKFYGILFLLIGLLIRYSIGRRKFNRRGIGGLQQFSNYEKAVTITLLEWIFKWVANIIILCAIFLLAFGTNHSKPTVQQGKPDVSSIHTIKTP